MSKNATDRLLITEVNPRSPISETYRMLRTNVDFSMIDQEMKTIMVTSSGPGEGKTTTLANLAITYSQANKKTLIIDADMRKPMMHHCFKVSNRAGLSNILSSQISLEEGLIETHIPNLSLITSGTIPPNPSEILSSKKMSSLVDRLKNDFDIIMFDTPPALVVTDAQVTASLCDGVLLVIDSGKVKRDSAVKMKSTFEHVQAKILGVVLNNKDLRDADVSYQYYYYMKYE